MSEPEIVESPTILIPKKNLVFDSQLLSTLMSCARLIDFRFNLNLVSNKGKSSSLAMGSIVHTFLEAYYKSIIGGGSRSDSKDRGVVSAQTYIQSSEVQGLGFEEQQHALQTCFEYLEYYKNDFWIPLEVECVKGMVLYEDDEIRVMWKAKFDLIMDTLQGIFPVDHKTMKQRRDTLTLNNQFTGQCLLLKTRRMYVNKIGFQKSLPASEKFTRVDVCYTADRLLEWQSEILPYWAKMYLMFAESGYWPPNFTHCENKYGMCQFKDVCEQNRNMREEALGHDFVVGEPWDIQND